MPGSWSDFLKLRSGPAPPPSSEAGAVRVYADSGGALRSVQSDGTDAAIGGSPSARGVYAFLASTVDDFFRGNIPFDAVDFDTDGFFDLVTHEATVPVGLSGLYLAVLGVDAFGVDAALPFGTAGINGSFNQGAAALDMSRKASDTSWVGGVSHLLRLQEGDTIHAHLGWVTDDDGLSVTLFGGIGGDNFFSLTYLGPLA